MLARDRIPHFLKQRIARAHLSNEKCGRFISDVFDKSARSPGAIVLAHISQHRNTESLARRHVESVCRNRGHSPALHLSHQRAPSDIISIG
jgi:hypothetical protein